jgi:hypothetical protein
LIFAIIFAADRLSALMPPPFFAAIFAATPRFAIIDAIAVFSFAID